MQISDALQLVDGVLRNKSLSLTDTINLSEIVLTNKQQIISDALSLLDSIKINKTLTLTELIQLSEAITVATGT